jgi:hypothetical protein
MRYGRCVADITELADRFRDWGRWETGSAMYSGLAVQIADDPDVLSLLQAAPPGQQLPVLLFAAVHDLVLSDPGLELAGWYPTVTAEPLGGDPFPKFRQLCLDRRDHLEGVISTRSTQTNEVARCAFFLPALSAIARDEFPLALVDIGASAGLNTLFDQFEYRYQPGGSLGGPSPVVIECALSGDAPIPSEFPTVTTRISLDISPIDVTDLDQARWLKACIWPDQAERFARLEGAIALAYDHEIDIRRGDAVDRVAELVREAAPDGHPVVMNSWVLNYLTHDERLAYLAELDKVGEELDFSWVFAESPLFCSGIPMPQDAALQQRTVVMIARWRQGARTLEHVGTAHPHGRWLNWGEAKSVFERD